MEIDLTDEEVKIIIKLMDAASVPISKAQEALDLYKKFKKSE